MLFCDIGNTTLHFFGDGRDDRVSAEGFAPATVAETVHYLCVNERLNPLLQRCDNWIDLRPMIPWEKYYESMGVDRIAACEAVENGTIIDAGSAVTVDIVKAGRFQGGFIYPGVTAMQHAYRSISPHLDYSFNFELELAKMPKNSRDAISYGYLRTFCSEVMRHDGPIILTGGDAEHFVSLFPSATIDTHLVFKGMKTILENGC